MNLADSVDNLQAYERVAVRPFASTDAARWEAFVNQCSEATFFHRVEWREIIADVFRHRPHYLLAERGGRVVGVLPLAEVKSRMFGHALVSLPFCVYGGPASDDVDAERALIEEARKLAQTLDVDHLELRNRTAKRPDWPHQDLYMTFRKEILPDVEENMLAIPRKQRAMVIKHGLRGVIDDTVDRFFVLYADNAHRHGTPPFSRRYFARLREVFGDSCETLTVVDPKGEAVSSVLTFFFRDEVLPYYAGDSVRARDLAANDFKYWDLLRRACERGLRVFDFGRSKQGTGSYDFKRNWGFVPTPLVYEYDLRKGAAIPQNNPLNPRYQGLIALWKRMPRFAANALGPHIVRNLG
jgi:FemAB-related protein (PEP-CTERM system-associated)